MIYYIDIIAIFVILIPLIYGSLSDLKTRQASNMIWIIFLPISFVLTLFRIVLNPNLLIISLISILITTILSVIAFYSGVIGGADSKAFICLGLAMPTYPIFVKQFFHPFFPISVFINSYVISCIIFLYAILRNLQWMFVKKEGLYAGLEDEHYWKKILAFISGYKIDLSKKNSDNLHYFPLEEIKFEDGTMHKNLRFFLRIDNGESKFIQNYSPEILKSKNVWVTPMLPMLVFITLGYLATLIIGDLMLRFVSLLF